MSDDGRMVLLLHKAYREDDWRRADDWRRMHARPDARTLQAELAVDGAPRSRLASLRRLIPHHA